MKLKMEIMIEALEILTEEMRSHSYFRSVRKKALSYSRSSRLLTSLTVCSEQANFAVASRNPIRRGICISSRFAFFHGEKHHKYKTENG